MIRTWICRWKIYSPLFVILASLGLLAAGVLAMILRDLATAAVLVALAVFALIVSTLTGKWWNHHVKGLARINNQQFAEAAEIYQQALREGRFADDDPRQAVLLDGLGQAVKGLGDCADAEPIARKALEAAKAAWGERSLAAAVMQVNLGNINLDLARMDDAQRCYETSMGLIRELKGDRHPLVSFCENNLGVVATMRRDHATAEAMYRKAMVQLGKKTWRRSPNPGLARNNLAFALMKQDKLDEAERLAQESIEIFRRVLPAGHLWHALPMHNLAYVRLRQNRLEEAEDLAREALKITERALGPEHPIVAKMLHMLVKVMMAFQAWDEAETLCMRELRFREDYLVPTHPDLADTVAEYAELLRRTGRPEEAADLLGQTHEREAAFRKETDTAIRNGGRWQIREA